MRENLRTENRHRQESTPGITLAIRRWAGALALAAGLFHAVPVLAEAPKPFPDFTFKRVAPPKPGEKPKLPQIEAAAPRATPAPDAAAAAPSAAGETPASARHGWFWTVISPDLAESGPGRLEPALNALLKPPAGQGVAAPRLSDMLDIARARQTDLLTQTVGTRVSPALVLAVIAVESGGRADAVSRAGATGLMQLIPATADRFGVTDVLDAGQNIKGGVAYLDWLLKEFGGDPILALAGYNAGENAVKKHKGVPPHAETRDYVPKVLAAFAVAKNLCRTPPELVSDGCVFNLTGG